MPVEFIGKFHFANEILVLIIPTALMAIDVITGYVKAWALGTFSSKKMRLGLSKKTGELAIIIVGELLSFSLGLPKYIMNGIAIYIIFMEVVSIIENAEKMGVPLPVKIHNIVNNIDDNALTEDDINEAIKTIEFLQRKEKEEEIKEKKGK